MAQEALSNWALRSIEISIDTSLLLVKCVNGLNISLNRSTTLLLKPELLSENGEKFAYSHCVKHYPNSLSESQALARFAAEILPSDADILRQDVETDSYRFKLYGLTKDIDHKPIACAMHQPKILFDMETLRFTLQQSGAPLMLTSHANIKGLTYGKARRSY